MAEKNGYYSKNGIYPPPMEVSSLEQCDSKCFDDDGRLKRSGKIFSSLFHSQPVKYQYLYYIENRHTINIPIINFLNTKAHLVYLDVLFIWKSLKE
jgi:hypothetical protein